MVDLPGIANVVPQVRAPQSRVSPAQIAAPYQELAQNLDKMGEVAGDYAKVAARKAGEEAVSEDGRTVTQPAFPIVGPASAEFARAARFTALARATPEIENAVARIRIEHQNDPDGYQKAVQAYKVRYINGDENMPPINDPALRGPIEKTILQAGGAGYRSVLAQTDQTNAQNTKIAVTSQITDISNKMSQLAFTTGVDNDDYRRMQANLGALYKELGSDPRLGYPKERIDSEVSELVSQHKTMALAGQAIRIMDGDSPTARADAKKWLIDKVYNDPSLNLTLDQRHKAVTTATALMEARSAESKALIDANKATVTALLGQLHSNQPYNPVTVNDAIENARKIGDAESYYKLTFAKGMNDWTQTMRALPLPAQLAGLRVLDTGKASDQAMQFFTSRGYSKEQAAGIVGNLIQESGLNPNTVHDSGTGLGIAGHRLERLDAMKAFAAARGKPVTDFQTQLEFIDHELGTTEGKTGAALKAAKTPEEAARAFINFERPQGWTAERPEGGHGYANRVANAVAVARGEPAGAGLSGAGAAWFNEARVEQVKRFREYLGGQAPGMIDTLIKRINTTTGVSDGELRDYSEMLREIGRDDLREKLTVAVAGHYGVESLDKLPESTRRALVVQTSPEAARSNFAFKVHEYMAGQVEETAKAMQATPYSTYATRTGGQPPAAYDFGKPETIGSTAVARSGQQAAFRANDGTGPVSVFEGKEAEAFGNLLANGDAGGAARALNGLAGLPPEVYQATLAQKPVKDAVTGMLGSKDPARMSAAMMAVDKYWRAEPAEAEAVFGGKAMTKLQAWQGLRGSYTSAEIAERLNASDDPSTAKAREAQKELAETETKSLTPADMAYKLGTGWPGIGRLTGSTPAAPFDSIKGGELVADYKATYTALRAYGVDADKASELAVTRLQSTWGVSAAAGNQVMKNPPERAYPAIGGSHDWLAEDLRSWVTRKAGPEFTAGRRSIEAGTAFAGAERNWELAGLVSDGQTVAEMGSGRPASYQVAIKKADGTLQILPSRIAFDPRDRIAEHEARLEQRRQSVDFLRAGQFQTGMPLP